jgi:threonine dehydratase
VIQQWCDDIVTVSDAQLIQTMKFCAERMKILVEPTGCLAAAAAFNDQTLAGRRVGVVLSGGNIDLARFAQLTQGTS